MSKIIGVTVGTPMSVSTIKEKIKPVTSVNGVEADESGNVEVSTGLPEATAADNGKVLSVGEDGLPVWQEAPESLPEGGAAGQVLTKKSGADGDAEWADLPSGTPEVTAEDNGKFLRVVNGVWAAEKLTNVAEEGA